MMETYTIFGDKHNYIRMRGVEVVDIYVSSEEPRPNYAGCCCSSCGNDPERYDKDLGKITCPYRDSCCNAVLRKISNPGIPEGQQENVIDLIHADVAKEYQRLKDQNENLIKSVALLSKNINEIREENKKEVEYWRTKLNRKKFEEIKRPVHKGCDNATKEQE